MKRFLLVLAALLAVLLVLKAAPITATLTVSLLLITLGFAAWNQLCATLFPAAHARCREHLRSLPLRCYLMGVLTLALEAWAISVTGATALAVPFGLLDMLWLSLSLPAVAGLAGEGLGVQGRWAPAAGSLPLGLSAAFPVLGWLCLSQLLVAALGAATLPRRWSRA